MSKETTFIQMFPNEAPAEIEDAKQIEAYSKDEYQAYKEAEHDAHEYRVLWNYRAPKEDDLY
jgi:hypothetical protein